MTSSLLPDYPLLLLHSAWRGSETDVLLPKTTVLLETDAWGGGFLYAGPLKRADPRGL